MNKQTIFQFDDDADDFDSRLICKNCGAEVLCFCGVNDSACQECCHQDVVDEVSYLPTSKEQNPEGRSW